MPLPSVVPPPMVMPGVTSTAVVTDPGREPVAFESQRPLPPSPERTEKLSVHAEFKMGQPGVFSTVTVGITVSTGHIPGDAADRSAQLDDAFAAIHETLERQSARIMEWRAAVGQVVPS